MKFVVNGEEFDAAVGPRGEMGPAGPKGETGPAGSSDIVKVTASWEPYESSGLSTPFSPDVFVKGTDLIRCSPAYGTTGTSTRRLAAGAPIIKLKIGVRIEYPNFCPIFIVNPKGYSNFAFSGLTPSLESSDDGAVITFNTMDSIEIPANTQYAIIV